MERRRAAVVSEQKSKRISQPFQQLRRLFKRLVRNTNVAVAYFIRSDPKSESIHREFLSCDIGIDDIAQRFRHFETVFIDDKSMGQNSLVGGDWLVARSN